MNHTMRNHPTLLRTRLPALVLPALLLASANADAATLSISNGFLSAQEFTSVGWDFSLHVEGVVAVAQQTVPSTLDLACSVDEEGEIIDCAGELVVGNASAAILMGSENNIVYWGIESGVSSLILDIHQQWGQEVVARSVAPGWIGLPYFAGGQWTLWYEQSNFPTDFENISGLDYESLFPPE